MAADKPVDPISTDISELIEVFTENLAEVQFPDVDAGRLAELAGVVRDKAADLARLSEQMAAARQALDEAQDELRQTARRGLAYAKVYAEGDASISSKLAAIALDKKPAAGKPARKKRKKNPDEDGAKRKKSTGELPFVAEPDSPEAAA